MRWATYNRLMDRLVAADGVADERLVRRPGRGRLWTRGGHEKEQSERGAQLSARISTGPAACATRAQQPDASGGISEQQFALRAYGGRLPAGLKEVAVSKG
jgi:hypothetical protein